MVYQILKDIEATSSRLEKEAILNANRLDTVLKQVFFLAYDPFTQFYIRKIPKYEPNNTPHAASLGSMLPSLNDLSNRVVTGNAAIERLTMILEAVNADGAKVIERIIGKDLRCGASASTANKIWPKLIHEYPCMLCSPSDEKTLAKIEWPAMVQLKMDGMRFNAIVKDGTVDYRSRNGKEIQGISHLDEFFITLSGHKNKVYDGELLIEMDDGAICDRQTGNGILNKAVKGTITASEAKLVRATIWDVIDYEDFINGYSGVPYWNRITYLKNFVYGNSVRLVEHDIASEITEARATFDRYLADGQEGIILKDLNSPWEDKRVKHQLKFKAELDCDLEVVGYEEGTGKYVGKLGALVCSSRQSDASPVTVSIGSGFSDDLRDSLWNDRDTLIGRIVAVTYNAKIENKQGGKSLFLPRFIEIREDKDIADSEVSIK